MTCSRIQGRGRTLTATEVGLSVSAGQPRASGRQLPRRALGVSRWPVSARPEETGSIRGGTWRAPDVCRLRAQTHFMRGCATVTVKRIRRDIPTSRTDTQNVFLCRPPLVEMAVEVRVDLVDGLTVAWGLSRV